MLFHSADQQDNHINQNSRNVFQALSTEKAYAGGGLQSFFFHYLTHDPISLDKNKGISAN